MDNHTKAKLLQHKLKFLFQQQVILDLNKMKNLVLICFFIFCSINGQESEKIKIKQIKSFDKVYVFIFKDLKTKKIDYFFSYKRDICDNGVEIKKGKKYKINLAEINIRNQNDGNQYSLGLDDFTVPINHKLYYSDDVKGLYFCK